MPPLRCSLGMCTVTSLGLKKLEWWGYLTEKKFDDMFSRLNAIHERDGRTDDTTTRLVARF